MCTHSGDPSAVRAEPEAIDPNTLPNFDIRVTHNAAANSSLESHPSSGLDRNSNGGTRRPARRKEERARFTQIEQGCTLLGKFVTDAGKQLLQDCRTTCQQTV